MYMPMTPTSTLSVSCPSTFRKFTTLYSHVHRQMLETRVKSTVDTQNSMEEDDHTAMDTADYEGELLDFLYTLMPANNIK